ncbi:MAG: class I SAM-dependent methyltransferase [bacterium]|nr:class I SAM-dependent methyltransferase [bacterium]
MTGLILALNNVFRRPGVGGRESTQAYSQWEYEWGRSLVEEYLEPPGDLQRKKVLDIGCGLGGKTVAYGESGAADVYGVDLSLENIRASSEFADRKSPTLRRGFFASDAARLPLCDDMFDTVIANDAMEHFAEPEAAIREMARVTKPGGVIWLFFTPHFSPLGSHLYDYVYTPWCHLLFSRGMLKKVIRRVLRERNPGASERDAANELDEIMRSYDEDINHMTVRRFFRIVKNQKNLCVSFKELKPPKYRALKPLTKVPLLRELFTGTVVCRLQRMGAS